MSHTFHQSIYRVLVTPLGPGHFVWDTACGGSQWVSLFRQRTKSRSARYACADAALIVGASLRLIIEIEEAGANGFPPTRIAGKLTTTALCQYFVAGGQHQPVPFGKHVTFVQVVNSAGLKPGSQKLLQYANMEHDIQERVMPLGSIAAYRLIACEAHAFESDDAGDQLRMVVKSVVRSEPSGAVSR